MNWQFGLGVGLPLRFNQIHSHLRLCHIPHSVAAIPEAESSHPVGQLECEASLLLLPSGYPEAAAQVYLWGVNLTVWHLWNNSLPVIIIAQAATAAVTAAAGAAQRVLMYDTPLSRCSVVAIFSARLVIAARGSTKRPAVCTAHQ